MTDKFIISLLLSIILSIGFINIVHAETGTLSDDFLDDMARLIGRFFGAIGIAVNAVVNAIGWLVTVICFVIGVGYILSKSVKKK